ncbi:acetate/propionate family kinase [Verticiella sediminum]|uniref:Acetate kinase n=1 Tax=Verticiella sediminum TaxID=1247510 RepID=A0A556AYG5_9BURK|nr:acetate/propionate family kinase [Verticiella sediminum]TSH97971.1 acetate/propionate family kinase [Verticiella sediminum]
MPTDDAILVLNCGSSSIKFAVFAPAQGAVPREPAWKGQVKGIGGAAPVFEESGCEPRALAPGAAGSERHDALACIRERVLDRLEGRGLAAVAHRVVHGGSRYFEPVRVESGVLADLRSYIPLAPLHQPFALEAIEVLLSARPDLPQVACFDTGFHHTLPRVEQMLPLDRAAYDRGLRRYGFHGLSYQYLATVLPERLGDAAHGRIVCAHLGSGASLCALQGLRSVATTMGFSALDGLMMGTRCGSLDPGAVLYLMEIEKLSLEDVAHVLYHESGLLGMSGVSADVSQLLSLEAETGEQGEHVREALALYVRRIVREIGSLAAALGGLDGLVFTAGVGEHAAPIRQRVCEGLAFLGVRLDGAANAAQAARISAPDSTVSVLVEPTNEEWVAASQAVAMLSA